MGGRPRGLEIEAASDAVEVNAFADKVEARGAAALHGAEIDGVALDAAGGDELVLVGGLAFGLEAGGLEGVGQGAGGGFGKLAPSREVGDFAGGDEALPQAAGNRRDGGVADELGALGLADFGEAGFDGLGAHLGQPVDEEGEVVILGGEVAGFPRG